MIPQNQVENTLEKDSTSQQIPQQNPGYNPNFQQQPNNMGAMGIQIQPQFMDTTSPGINYSQAHVQHKMYSSTTTDPNAPQFHVPPPQYTNVNSNFMNQPQLQTIPSNSFPQNHINQQQVVVVNPPPPATDDDINPETGEPYLPGEKRKKEEEKKKKEEKNQSSDQPAYGVLFGTGAATTAGAGSAGAGVLATILVVFLLIFSQLLLPLLIGCFILVLTGAILGCIACSGGFSGGDD